MGSVKALGKTVEQEIINLHNGILSAMCRSVADAIEIGRLLMEQKATLDHGEFLPWIERKLPFNVRTAQNYMAVFRHRDKCESVSYLQEAYRIAQIEDRRLKAPEASSLPPFISM